MLQLYFIALCLLQSTDGFRGPHHPRSPVSHHHYTPQRDVKLTEDAQLLHDTSHLAEDMGDLADHIDVANMNEQELDFYYFKAHDMDNNTKLDGLEMLHAIQHTFHENSKMEPEMDLDSQLPNIIELIDRVLDEDDLDNDGYLSYIEYVHVRQKSFELGDNAAKDLRLEIRK